jgi:hypothetical protein
MMSLPVTDDGQLVDISSMLLRPSVFARLLLRLRRCHLMLLLMLLCLLWPASSSDAEQLHSTARYGTA